MTAQPPPPYKAQKDDWIVAVLSDSNGGLLGRWVRFVRPDGTILIGHRKIELHADGMADTEIADALLQEMVAKGFASPMNLTSIQVTIFPKNSDKIFVSGEMIRSDAYPYSPGMTVRKIVDLAGGVVFRSVIRVKFANGDPDKALADSLLETNDFPIGPGDAVFVTVAPD